MDREVGLEYLYACSGTGFYFVDTLVDEVSMPISSLVTLLSVIGVIVGIRLALFKLFPPMEQVSLPVETTTASQATEETLPEVSMWPVVVLLCVVVVLVIGLMVFGNAIGG